MRVYLLYHISHAARSELVHRDSDGQLLMDPELGDDIKLLGCYSTIERANARIETARQLPGFQDEPECFQIGDYVVDEDEWTEGYVIVSH